MDTCRAADWKFKHCAHPTKKKEENKKNRIALKPEESFSPGILYQGEQNNATDPEAASWATESSVRSGCDSSRPAARLLLSFSMLFFLLAKPTGTCNPSHPLCFFFLCCCSSSALFVPQSTAGRQSGTNPKQGNVYKYRN